MEDEKTILALLHQLAGVGIWLQRKQDGTVIIGPADLVAKHRDLIEQMRPHKKAISRIIESQLVHALFGEADDDPRFESDICPECEQQVYVMAPDDGESASTRRLSVHRTPDGKAVCPGGGLAATVEVSELLNAFVKDCATELPSALTGWRSLWSEFRVWSYEHRMLPLPAPEAHCRTH